MKRILVIFFAIALILFSSTVRCAAESALFDDEVQRIEDSIGDDVSGQMDKMGTGSVKEIVSNGIDTNSIWEYLLQLLSAYSGSPLSSLVLLTAVLLLASVAESYTYSLRYTETKEIMGAVVALFVASAAVRPISEMVASSATVISGASSVLTVYLPVMAGILMFSGHAISSGGYYAAVMTACQVISQITATVLTPLLSVFLSLSVCAGISARVRIGGLIEIVSKGFKYVITISMSIFIAIIGLNSALGGAADSVADKAARFSLSSFIPIIGASVSEAYSALRSSVAILRSGIGVFVILAIFVSFAPLLVRALLWSASIGAAKLVSEALSVSSASAVLNGLSAFMAAYRAMLIAVMTVFLISSSVMIFVGGQL